MNPVFKILDIKRYTGNIDYDTKRLNEKVTIEHLEEGKRALFKYVVNDEKGFITSPVKWILVQYSGGIKGTVSTVHFATENTEYQLERID